MIYVVCHFQKCSTAVICGFFGSTICTDLHLELRTEHFTYLPLKRAKKERKRAKIGIFTIKTIWYPPFNGTGWKEVETAFRTSRLSNLAHLADPECPKCDPRGINMVQNRLKIAFWPHKFGLETIYWVRRGETRLEHNMEHPDRPGGVFFNFFFKLVYWLQKWQK